MSLVETLELLVKARVRCRRGGMLGGPAQHCRSIRATGTRPSRRHPFPWKSWRRTRGIRYTSGSPWAASHEACQTGV